MRRRTTGFVTVLVAVLAAGTAIVTDTVPTVTETVTTASPASPLSPAFIKASGRYLMLDGKSVKLTGFNFYNANSNGNDCAYAGNLNDLSTWGSGIGVVRA